MKQSDKRLKFEGVAQSSTRVSAFMRNIDGSEWLENPELEVVETKKDAAPAASSRCSPTRSASQLPEGAVEAEEAHRVAGG